MIAFIPARRGSQRLPRKALADLGGKPLIQWTIEAAKAADRFERILVSSDDPDVLGLASDLDVMADWRLPEFCRDHVTLDTVLRWYDFTMPVYVLLPTSPFRSAASIRAAYAAFEAEPVAAGLLSVVLAEPPDHALTVEAGRVVIGPAFHVHRAALPPAYRHEGGHLIRTRHAGPIIAFVPPPEEVLDINTPADLDFAEWMLSKRAPAARI